MKWMPLAALAFAAVTPPLARAAPLIRFCPAEQARTYPLESRRGVQGLLLQNVAIVNPDPDPIRIETITIKLLDKGEVVDRRRLDGPALDRAGDNGRALQAGGEVGAVPFQFCGRDLVHVDEKLGGPVLGHNEALLIGQQVFAFNGARDTLQVSLEADAAGRTVFASGALPIRSDFSKTTYLFPLRGVWLAGNGPGFHTDHRWAIPEEFAFDMAKLGPGGLTHSGDGTRFSDYYAYGAGVLAMADGKVVRAHDGEAEDPRAMQQPGETQQAYMARLRGDQAARLAKGVGAIAGNFVMIDHGNGEFALYAHLQPGSLLVREGETVRAAQPIAKLGSSGNSTEPHLHFQLCDRPDPLMCAGIPMRFGNVTILWSDEPRPIQSGDVVQAQ